MCILFYLRQDFVIYARVTFSSLGELNQWAKIRQNQWASCLGFPVLGLQACKTIPSSHSCVVCVCVWYGCIHTHTHICMSECGYIHTIAHTFRQCVLSVLAFYSIWHRVSCLLPWTPGYLACKFQRILHPSPPSFARGILWLEMLVLSMFWRFELKFSCLSAKCFYPWATCLAHPFIHFEEFSADIWNGNKLTFC